MERGEEGVQVLEDAIRLLETSGDLEALWVALYNVVFTYQLGGKYDLSLAHTERALAIAERLGNLKGIADMKLRHGDLLFDLGHWEQACQELAQVVTMLHDERPSVPLLFSYLNLGLIALAQGQTEAATEHFQRGLALAERSDDPGMSFWASSNMAYRDLLEGRPEAVHARLEPFLDRSSWGALEQAWKQVLLGWASVELGDLERAGALLAEASTVARNHKLLWNVVGVLHVQARLALRQGKWQEAEHALAEALAFTQAMHIPYPEAQTLYLYGLLHLQQGETRQARECLEAALAICARLGERLYARQIEQALAHLGTQE